MPTEKEVYQSHADRYEQLVLREDYQNNIPAHIQAIQNTDGADIIELGVGTGRLTRWLVKRARSVSACDASHHMLIQAKKILGILDHTLLCAADMRSTPFPSNSADLVIAGWSFCYLAVWGKENWRQELEQGLEECRRLLKPGGALILLENYGTGSELPNPPNHLNEYFGFLSEAGFHSHWFRTDYQFCSLQEALELSGFFFGEEIAAKVEINNWVILPECTGLFWQIL